MMEYTGGRQKKGGISIKMDKLWILVLVTLSTGSPWIFQSVECFRNDFIQSPRQGCIWSIVANGNASTPTPVTGSKNGKAAFSLDCNLRTLSVDFWNYTFSKDQVEQTTNVGIKCSDKLFFESFLTPSQSLFRLVNLKQITIEGCKIRKMPGRIWGSLGFLKSLNIQSQNGDWSSSVGLEIEAGAFEGLGKLETLDLSQNNVWSLPNKHIFCPLKSLSKLNLSSNSLSDIEELSEDLLPMSMSTVSGSGSNNGYCALSLQNLDLSFNSLRRVNNNAFSRMRKLSELRLQNNLLEELEDSAFAGLGQLRLVNLSSNRLVALPPSIFRLNLAVREINLNNNSISALSPQVFSGLDSLLSLDLSKNLLSSQWIRDNVFSGIVRLVILKLSFNQLSYIDGTIYKDLISLQALYLNGNRIETIHPQAFSTLTNLHILHLSNNRLSTIDSKAFSNLFVLTQLYLDHNKIRSMDDNSLKNCTSLTDLGLTDNLLQEVPVAIRGLSHLVSLDIGENKIGLVSNESFSGLGQLYGLRIVDNKMTEVPHGFCDQLKKLRVLNLAQNKIKKISSTAFNSCPELRALRLDSNLLEELPITLAPQLPSLLWLNVSVNNIRWVDYHYLPATIEWLDVSYNLLEQLGGLGESDKAQSSASYSLRVLDASFNKLKTLDYTTIPPTLETLRINHNQLKTVQPDTFSRSTRLLRVELVANQLEILPLSSLRIPQVPVGKPLPQFYIGENNLKLTCENEWLTRVNQLTFLRTYPRIVDLNAIVLSPSFSRPIGVMPLVEAKPKDFLCEYKSHCFQGPSCPCCEFEYCDCKRSCPGNCSCYHDTAWSSNIVGCSNLAYEEVPSLPMDATEIFLDGNNMSTLGSHIFIGKKNLRVLFLNDSKVETIKNKTFNGLRSLEVLRLEDNLLSELNGYEFADLESLREIYLQNNILRFIAKNTFGELKFLQVIRLDGNMLVDYNSFSFLELSKNSYLTSIYIQRNPLSCDCGEFLIPLRTWAASKIGVIADFSLATCQEVNSTHVITGSSSGSGISSSAETDHHHYAEGGQVIPNPLNNGNSNSHMKNRKIYPIQMRHFITSMCNHNSELNFNFNPVPAIESEILSNHISAMAGGAEKVTIPHPSDREIQFGNADSSPNMESMNTLLSLILSLTALIVLVVVIVAIFRKEIYYWIYTRMCFRKHASVSAQELRGSSGTRGFFSIPILPSLFCCGEKAGKKSRSSGDESDKLFDAYFLYSKKDEDILSQKIAPELEDPASNKFRLCLHYRDLCLNQDNPWNTDMILTACEASTKIVLVLSKNFLQSELSHSHFRAAIQSVINRHQKKLILILLPPFSEQNLSTIYPELKNSSQVKNSTLHYEDNNFWSKFKLILPTPSNTFSSTMARNRRGASLLMPGSSIPAPLIDLHIGGSSNNSNASGTMSTYTINRAEFPYSSGHQYHRNILPYQIPISNSSTLNPPVPKHHIALSTPFYQHSQNAHPHSQAQYYQSQQNFSLYNGSQHSGSQSHYFLGNYNNVQNFLPVHELHQVPIPGHPGMVYPMATLPHPHQPSHHFSFNESFRRHLHQQQQQNNQMPAPPVLQFAKQNSTGNSGGNGGHCGPGPGYQPLEPNYSSSAISSSAEELEHVYAVLDSPLQSPNSANTTSTSCGESQTQVKNISESANKLGSRNNSNNSNGKEFSSQSQPACTNDNGQQIGIGANGQMYFV